MYVLQMYIGGVFLIELVVISLVIVPVITLAPTVELKKKFVESACSMSTLLAIGGNALFLVCMFGVVKKFNRGSP